MRHLTIMRRSLTVLCLSLCLGCGVPDAEVDGEATDVVAEPLVTTPIATNVLLFGDSITAGYYDAVLRELTLRGRKTQVGGFSGTGLMNAGMDWVANMKTAVKNFRPAYVVLEGVGNYRINDPGYTDCVVDAQGNIVDAGTPLWLPCAQRRNIDPPNYGDLLPDGTINPNQPFFIEWERRAEEITLAAADAGAKVMWVTTPPMARTSGFANPLNNNYVNQIPTRGVPVTYVDLRAALGGDVFTPSVPTNCELSDSFNRPDADALGLFETGQSWYAVANHGTFGVRANASTVVVKGATMPNLALTPRLPSNNVTFDVNFKLIAGNGGVVFRYFNARNYWRLRYASGAWVVTKVLNNVVTELGRTPVMPKPLSVRVEASANTVNVYTDSVLRLTFTDPALNYAQKAGLAANALATTAYDSVHLVCPATTATRSWDGVHLDALGNAIAADLIVKAVTGAGLDP